MAYTPTNWVNKVTTLGPTNLNKLENGVQATATVADAALPASQSPKLIYDAKGDILVALSDNTPQRLAVGSDGYYLQADSSQPLGVKWAAGGGGGIPITIFDNKGDLVAAASNDTPAKLPVGADGLHLIADSSQAAGMKWAAGSLIGLQVITAVGTYTPTPGTNKILVECVGGGGGGGGIAATSGNAAAGGGGGGGAFSRKFLASGFSGVAVSPGAAGAAPAAGNNPGGAGGDSNFGAGLCLAKGGSGGNGSPAGTTQNIAGGAGGAAASGVGDMRASGGAGGGGMANTSTIVFQAGGHGGASVFGPGAPYVFTIGNATTVGAAGAQYGGGGSGASASGTVGAQAGGAGGIGVIVVYEFA